MEYHPDTTYLPEDLEATRKDQERQLVQEGMELWKARKEELQHQKLHEQRQLRRMLIDYWPWGKPGGGAPCQSALRRKNVPLEPPGGSPLLHTGLDLHTQDWAMAPMLCKLYHSGIRNITRYTPEGDPTKVHDKRCQLMIRNEEEPEISCTRHVTIDATHLE